MDFVRDKLQALKNITFPMQTNWIFVQWFSRDRYKSDQQKQNSHADKKQKQKQRLVMNIEYLKKKQEGNMKKLSFSWVNWIINISPPSTISSPQQLADGFRERMTQQGSKLSCVEERQQQWNKEPWWGQQHQLLKATIHKQSDDQSFSCDSNASQSYSASKKTSSFFHFSIESTL